MKTSLEGRTLAEEIDSISDPALRKRAMRKAIAAIDQVLENPPELGVEKRSDRAQRNK